MSEPVLPTQVNQFYGRGFNLHPQISTQVLRLSRDERENPYLVLHEFFECYHLNDGRELLWKWFAEVITSDGVISDSARGRSDSLLFYQKVEALIEANYLIVSRQKKRRRRQ